MHASGPANVSSSASASACMAKLQFGALYAGYRAVLSMEKVWCGLLPTAGHSRHAGHCVVPCNHHDRDRTCCAQDQECRKCVISESAGAAVRKRGPKCLQIQGAKANPQAHPQKQASEGCSVFSLRCLLEGRCQHLSRECVLGAQAQRFVVVLYGSLQVSLHDQQQVSL